MTRHMMTLVGALALVAAPLSGLAIAQTTTPVSPVTFVTAQPSGEWLAHVFFGAPVQNTTGEIVGNINDLMFDRSGRINTVVIGVGGFLGMGEKNVAVPYSALNFSTDKDNARVIAVTLSKEELASAPIFLATEKTAYDVMKDKAVELGKKASETAGQLKEQAMKKVDDLKKDEPKKP